MKEIYPLWERDRPEWLIMNLYCPDEIKEAEYLLSKGESVAIVGFGTFSVAKRAARKGRKPRTGEEIDIPEKIVPKFRPVKKLRVAIKN